MKQKFFNEIDIEWEYIASDIYNNNFIFKPEYEIIDGEKCISRLYKNEDIGGKFSLSLDNDLNIIMYNVFKNCHNLTGELIIPNSVEEISFGAFEGCTGFTGELIIPESTKYIGGCAFFNCNFSKIYVPKKHVKYYSNEWNCECNAEIIEY